MKTTDYQQELFIVVDKNDQVLGYRTRYDCHHDKSLIHRSVGVLVYNSKGELLMQKRSMTKDTYPGYWAISVGGHVTKGQSYKQAAKREMREELGIDAPLKPVKKWIDYLPDESEFGMLFKSYFDGPFSPEPKEIDMVKFFNPDQITKLVKSGEMQLSGGTEATLKKVGILY
jgi:isopentenyl-diphosphate Delta-isomerase